MLTKNSFETIDDEQNAMLASDFEHLNKDPEFVEIFHETVSAKHFNTDSIEKTALKELIHILSVAYFTKQQEISILQGQIASMDRQHFETKKQIASYSEKKNKEAKLSEIEIHAAMLELQEDKAKLKLKNKQLTEENESFTKNIKHFEKTLQKLEEEAAHLRFVNSLTAGEHEQSRKEAASLHLELKVLKKKVSELESTIAAVQHENLEFKEKNALLNERNKKLEKISKLEEFNDAV